MSNEFRHLNISAHGTIHDALRARRVLHAEQDGRMFIISHDDSREVALHLATQYARRGPTVAVLLSDEDLDAVAMATPRRDVDVLDARRDHQVVGQIEVNGDRQVIQLRTEYGAYPCATATTCDLRAGDLFTCGEFYVDGAGRRHGLVLYRALADYEAATGAVRRHILKPSWDTASPADRENLTSQFNVGPDRLVFCVLARADALIGLGVRELVAGR